MGFGDMLGKLGGAGSLAGLGNIDINGLKNSLGSVDGGFKNILNVANDNKAAFGADGPPKTRFAKILDAIDKVMTALKFLESLKGVKSAPIQSAVASGTSATGDLSSLKTDLLADKFASASDFNGEVKDIMSKYKDKMPDLSSFGI